MTLMHNLLSAALTSLPLNLQWRRTFFAAVESSVTEEYGSETDSESHSGSHMRLLTAIPVYNEERYLEPVLREVLRYADHVLVIDDGSTDQTPELLCRFPSVQVIRHDRNQGYGAGLRSAFERTLDGGYDGLITLDCDGQHQPSRIPELAAPLDQADIVSGSRYLKTFDPSQRPPEARRRINVEVTRWLNDCLGLNLTDAFCGFKAYRVSALARFQITDNGYAMPLQVWVQAVEHGMTIVEVPVPLIYLDESRAFGGSLDDADYRLKHYRAVFQDALARAGLAVAEGCAG
jgi:glycosyltransferase involved in cell wall biosynthesis